MDPSATATSEDTQPSHGQAPTAPHEKALAPISEQAWAVQQAPAAIRDEQALAPGLYLVATPIGNLEDMTLRGLRILRSVDCIACEDTRQTAKLLSHFGIQTPTISLHAHNEHSRATEDLLPLLDQGGRLAVVSDAGTPCISDPGMLLVRTAIVAGIPVFPIPGANAALSALIASGLPTEQFTFHGFLPEKAGARRSALEALSAELSRASSQAPGLRIGNGQSGTTQIFYEAPHRILDTLADIDAVFGTQAKVVIARELTKLHEEFLRGSPFEVRATLATRDRVRGEIVLLLELSPAAPTQAATQSLASRVTELQATEKLDEKDALKRAARERGIGKSEAYRELQRERATRR